MAFRIITHYADGRERTLQPYYSDAYYASGLAAIRTTLAGVEFVLVKKCIKKHKVCDCAQTVWDSRKA